MVDPTPPGSTPPEGAARPPALTRVSYARNPEHERFLLSAQGECRGRYLLSYLGGIRFLGPPELRAQLVVTLGGIEFAPDGMYSVGYVLTILDAACRAGLSMQRLGELQIPAYKRAKPWRFERGKMVEGLAGWAAAHVKEATFGTIRATVDAGAGQARVFRKGHPDPCELFTGVLVGYLRAFDTEGTVRETACEWEGGGECCYEVAWTPAPAGRVP